MNDELLELVRKLNQTFIYNFSYIEFVEDKLLTEKSLLESDPLFEVYVGFRNLGHLAYILNVWQNNQSIEFPLQIVSDETEENEKKTGDKESETVELDLQEKYLSNPKKFIEDLNSVYISDFPNYQVKYDVDDGPYTYLRFKNSILKDSYISYKLKYESIRHNIETSKKATLVNVCNNFENYISDLIGLILKTYPNMLKNAKKEIELNEILGASDLSELKNKMIDEHIVKIMYGDVDKWIKKLVELNPKINENIDKKLIDTVSYIYLVRNLIVHNDGEINALFKDKVKNLDFFDIGISYSDEKPRIYFSDVNVNEITEYVFLLGYQIGYLFYNDKESKDSIEKKLQCFENDISLDFYSSKKQRLALKMYEFLWKQRKEFTRSLEMVIAINYAMALKSLDMNFDVILEKVDFSGCSNEYTLCICALRDDIDGVINEFPLVKLDGLTFYDMVSWPILTEIVKTDRFIEFAKESFPENELVYYNFYKESDILIMEEESDSSENEEND